MGTAGRTGGGDTAVRVELLRVLLRVYDVLYILSWPLSLHTSREIRAREGGTASAREPLEGVWHAPCGVPVASWGVHAVAAGQES